MFHFDPDWDHLFSSNQAPAFWSWGGFTRVILVLIKLESLKVRTKRVRCEHTLNHSCDCLSDLCFFIQLSLQLFDLMTPDRFHSAQLGQSDLFLVQQTCEFTYLGQRHKLTLMLTALLYLINNFTFRNIPFSVCRRALSVV